MLEVKFVSAAVDIGVAGGTKYQAAIKSGMLVHVDSHCIAAGLIAYNARNICPHIGGVEH